MTKDGSRRTRWVSFLGIVMLLLSATPIGVAAQVGLTPVGEVAQADAGMGIEVLLVDCDPGAPNDPSDLIPGCTDGRANLNINVASTDPALGIDQDKVSVKPSNPGPGVINTGAIPQGEYRVQIDLPTEDYRFFFECRTRGADTNNVDVRPVPDGAQNAFLVNNAADADVVCQVWITPNAGNPTMEITYRECDRADMPTDGRSFEDLQANCNTVSNDPPTFSVRPAGVSGDPATPHELDAQGVLDLTLAPGDIDIYTNLDEDQWGEYLFCEYQGQPRYEKEFNQNGFTTFTSLLPGEDFECQWFAVSAADLTADTTQPEQDNQADTEGSTTETQAQNLQQTTAEGDVQFTITYKNCTRGDFPGTERSAELLAEHCTYFAAPGPTFTIVNADDSRENPVLNDQGVLTFTHSPESFSIFTNLDPNQWGEYLFCSFDGGEVYSKPFPQSGINGFENLNAGEVFNCTWYGVLASDTPTENQGEILPPAELGSISVEMKTCGVGYEGASPETLAQMQIDCTDPVTNTLFSLSNGVGDPLTQLTNDAGEVAFTELEAGSWSLWSEVPGEFATEYYFCSANDDPLQFFGLTDRGVADFNAFTDQNVRCEVYLVPENLRGDITGATVEVHLSLCPANYAGSNWYNDCHANGLDGYDFTLTGPAGEVTSPTVVERTPGPGIVVFTELPAGDYELRGGPPQHDGTVFLYCSDPSTNTQVETTFEGGMGFFTLTDNQSIVCDWYFTPTSEAPVTPTPEPTYAEIFTTMFICPPDVNVAGASFSQLDDACSDRLSDVPMSLQSPGGVPITANTGASGAGAVRFYDLTGGDYVLTPKLPAEYVSAAVYCDLDGGNVYQKALSNGATTFVNVDGELISCSWFVTAKPQPAPGPTGSITVREMLCEGDRSTIVDWERECRPGASGVNFTITSSGGGVNQTLSPNAQGVAVFSGLPNDYYQLEQSEGAWCRAKAERVDSQSRVIVSGGSNTDVFLYQCNQEIGLPETGAGPVGSSNPMPGKESIMLGIASLPMFAIAAWHIRRWQLATSTAASPEHVNDALTRTRDGYRYR